MDLNPGISQATLDGFVVAVTHFRQIILGLNFNFEYPEHSPICNTRETFSVCKFLRIEYLYEVFLRNSFHLLEEQSAQGIVCPI